jgi:tetratricopeptide (TPR) repeat protein
MRQFLLAIVSFVSLATGVLPPRIALGQGDHPARAPQELVTDGKGKEVRPAESWIGDHAKTARETDVEAALLAEEWKRVDSLIGETTATTQAVERLIKAHACLALNRNNDSILLFLNASGDDLKSWHHWAARFSEEHPKAPLGQYFLGDSFARLSQYDKAVQTFDAGLTLQADNALLLNAQGVAYAKLDSLPEARRCFEGALVASKARLADAHASLGAHWIQRSDGAEGAIASFTRAVELSPEFVFAIHGRACAKLVINSPDVGDDLASMYVGVESVDAWMDGNLTRYAEAVVMADKDLASALTALRESGTTLAKQWTADPSVLKADYHLRAAQEIGSNTTVWAPIRQFLVWRNENDAAKNIKVASERSGGWDVVNAYRKQVEPELGRVLDTVVSDRIGRDNATGAQFTANVSTAAQAGKILATGYGMKNPSIAKESAAFGLGMDVTKFAADKINRQQSAYKAFADGYEIHVGVSATPSFTSIKVAPALPHERGLSPGGADLSLARVRWDNGEWPFVPLYGLAYGLQPSPDSTTSEPREAPRE